MNIIAKFPFRDKENKFNQVVVGQPLTVTPERGKRLIELGLATAGGKVEVKNLQEADEVEPSVKGSAKEEVKN